MAENLALKAEPQVFFSRTEHEIHCHKLQNDDSWDNVHVVNSTSTLTFDAAETSAATAAALRRVCMNEVNACKDILSTAAR